MATIKSVSLIALCVFCLPKVASADTKPTTTDTIEVKAEDEADLIPRTKRVLTQVTQTLLTGFLKSQILLMMCPFLVH